MEYIDWDPALTRAATGCHIGLMERNPSVTGFRLVTNILYLAFSSSPVTRPGVVTINGKRMSSTRAAGGQQESPNHAHEDNVRFVSQAWQRVERELRMCRDDGPLSYREKEPNPELRSEYIPNTHGKSRELNEACKLKYITHTC
uniref:Uncharacterized protein n=1 Tax=Eptatretus burgeri TaxID=7764 RepID=A0A8C4R839_EPTBU